MARLVTKFKFLKSGDRKGAGGYAKYIATREGVERIDDSQRLAPATKQQETLIEKILKDFPDSATLMEYADYQSEPNMGNASEFIFRAIEDNADDLLLSGGPGRIRRGGLGFSNLWRKFFQQLSGTVNAAIAAEILYNHGALVTGSKPARLIF